ncbi:hypothetical protein JTE90_000929 [Oedothorax gibbosus]|uniref:EB domain-containing protein n=1 Tax=Oedothorax gibbosus TaxID=931172 RepID=A0AAV6U375_9ARAC|nr:hypothetical protein JTE90_000929 [Oedothorax gibbosus]
MSALLLFLLPMLVVSCSATHPSPVLRLTKRSPLSSLRCSAHEDCSTDLPGSVCVHESCVCPQGYLPDGCFRVGAGRLGQPCEAASQCGEVPCRGGRCGCPEGYQPFSGVAGGTPLCLLWHRPTRMVDRCRSSEECRRNDPHSVCKKRWCQCAQGHQLFETVLFGRRHRCFETTSQQCSNTGQCTQLEQTLDRHCTCLYGFCHCLADANFTMFDLPPHNTNWYQRWKKDIVLATRLLFVTVVLFFVPCFIYVTLGMRERSRHLFSQLAHHPPPPSVHYHRQRRSVSQCPPPRTGQVQATPVREDPPPSYDEIVRKDDPPPPYQACS